MSLKHGETRNTTKEVQVVAPCTSTALVQRVNKGGGGTRVVPTTIDRTVYTVDRRVMRGVLGPRAATLAQRFDLAPRGKAPL